MPKNRNTPALYEVFGRTGAAPGRSRPVEVAPTFAPPRVQVESIAPESASPSGPASPRLIRLPVGYLYVALAVVVLLIVGSYFVGVSRGRAQAQHQPASGGDAAEGASINDPTLNGNGLSGGLAREPGPAPSGTDASRAGHGTANPEAPPRQTPAGPRTPDRDTRRAGLNYIIVERFEPAEAWAVKEFLKRHGIDVLVLRDNNPSLLQVVTAEGFQGWNSNAAAQALNRRLEELGRQWKTREGGSKDFSQRLPKKHE